MDHVKTDIINQYKNKTVKELLNQLDSLKKEKRKFTAKDKALFERLDGLNQKYTTFNERIETLIENEERTHELITTFDSNTQERISKVFKTFLSHFQQFFNKITGTGKADAKLLKDTKAKGKSKLLRL
jgi:chromosome segregation ATPase